MQNRNLFALMAYGVFAVTATATAQTVAVGPVVHPTTGNRYYLLNTPNWGAAEAWAVAHGSHLTAINNSAENAWVRDTVLNAGGQLRKAFLGLNDAQVEGAFAWTNGQSVSYTNWGAGEPHTGSTMDYVAMFSDGGWYARTNMDQPFAIAEFTGAIRVPQELSTIQGAINAAADGMTILVGPGTYFERPVISNKRLIIRGVEGASSTIIDAQNAGTAFLIDHLGTNECVLEGLTIRNGYAESAAGLLVLSDNVVVKDCIFHGNQAIQRGGAIYLGGGGTITNCLIYDNRAIDGAGVHVFSPGVATSITNCTIVNSPGLQGHAVYAAMSDVTVRNSILRGSPPILGILLYGSIDVAYCNTSTAIQGAGNISVDPQLGPGYRLSANSPCIDAGTNGQYPFSGYGAPLDGEGEGRFVDDPVAPDNGIGPGPVIDMGAFEFRRPPALIGDINGDGAVNGLDVAPLVAMLLL